MNWSRGGAVSVYLNVYDLVPNNWGHSWGFGLYHTGVEMMGQEYSFYGGDQAVGGGGILATVPRTVAPPAKFRESIEMGQTRISSSEFKSIISDLAKDFTGDKYHITAKNCNSFSDALCVALLNKHIPSWINRAATLAGPLVSGWLGGAPPVSTPTTAMKAFEGQGYKLSGAATTTASSSPAPALSKDAVGLKIEVDEEKPVTTLQFRLHDGTRLQAKFNHHHTVGDVKRYLDSATSTSSYQLCTSFPFSANERPLPWASWWGHH